MNLHAYLQELYHMAKIPLAIYQDDKCILSYPENSFASKHVYRLLHPYLTGQDTCLCFQTPEFLHYGFVRFFPNPTSKESQVLLLGPVLEGSYDLNNAQQILQWLGDPNINLKELQPYLRLHSQIPASRFLSSMKMLNNLLNDSLDIRIVATIVPEIDELIINSFPTLNYSNDFSKALEKEMLNYIKQGKPRELLSYISKLPEIGLPHSELASSHIRSLKNTYAGATALASRAAVEGGLNYSIAMFLSDQYIYKMEYITNAQELLLSLAQMMLDFAKRTKKIQGHSFSDPLVLKINNYIFANINEKISLESIANHLNYSTAHLCRHFKQITGKTLIEQVQEIKIEEAETLLEITDLSLSEITTRLGFSSQSYFQKIFKKITGVTPTYYRSQHQL